jgi:hypothetical protein
MAGYVVAVREALGDLPAATRDELVEDLRTHPAEVIPGARRAGRPFRRGPGRDWLPGRRVQPTTTGRERRAADGRDGQLRQ